MALSRALKEAEESEEEPILPPELKTELKDTIEIKKNDLKRYETQKKELKKLKKDLEHYKKQEAELETLKKQLSKLETKAQQEVTSELEDRINHLETKIASLSKIQRTSKLEIPPLEEFISWLKENRGIRSAPYMIKRLTGEGTKHGEAKSAAEIRTAFDLLRVMLSQS